MANKPKALYLEQFKTRHLHAFFPHFILATSMTPIHSMAQENISDSTIEEVKVIYKRQSLMTEITEDAEKLTRMPGALGDPLQAAFALPGVVAAGGSADALSVRGSSPEDNLFEVDFMPAGYIFHDFGNSIFNRHLIQDFQLYSAAYGSSYSNATGAVFDVTLRNPKNQPLHSTIDFSLFNSGVFFEGGLTQNTAFYLSGRKSMLPLFFTEGEELEDDDGDPTGITIDNSPDDNDYQGKLQWDINNNNVLTASFTGANDMGAASFSQASELALRFPELVGSMVFDQGFTSQSVIWDHYGQDWTVKTGIGHLENNSKFTFGKNADNPEGYFEQYTLSQTTYKMRAQHTLNPRQHLLLDAAYYDAQHNLSFNSFNEPCTVETESTCDISLGEQVAASETLNTPNAFIGVSHLWSITDRWESELGGQWQHNDYTQEDFVLPRLALRYFITENSSLRAKYGHYNRQQTLEFLSPSLGNPQLSSQTSRHSTLGFEQAFTNGWQWSIEAYNKTLSDLPLAVDHLNTNNSASSEPLGPRYTNETSGRAYGADVLINKNKTDRWYGWLSLSYSKSERTNDRTGTTLDYFADTPLVVNGVWNYDLSEHWNMGLNLTLRSGQAYTPIVGMTERDDFANRYLPIFGETNSERFELTKRLDIRFERKGRWYGKDTLLIFEVMNVLNQKNIQSIHLDYDEIDKTGEFSLTEDEDAFGLRPSIGFSITL